MKKLLILFPVLLFGIFLRSSGQLAIGFNTDGNTLSLSSDPMKKLTGELRVNTKYYNQAPWSYNDRGITQAYVLLQVFRANNAELYSGAGLGMNLLSDESEKWLSINIPLGLRINPFSKFPDLFIVGEYTPMLVTASGIPVIHSVSLGFRYLLRKE